jgi:adenylate cyclase
MGIEIERKFLVHSDRWQQWKLANAVEGVLYRQGYVPTIDKRTVRIRVAGSQGYLTLKGPVQDCSRLEFEYPIPVDDAMQMLDHFCRSPLIEKFRYKVPDHGLIWEIDEFLGENAGLLLAEVELSDRQQAVTLPDWVAEEVSGDARYFNSYLVSCPFQTWSESQSLPI